MFALTVVKPRPWQYLTEALVRARDVESFARLDFEKRQQALRKVVHDYGLFALCSPSLFNTMRASARLVGSGGRVNAVRARLWLLPATMMLDEAADRTG